MRVYPFKYKLKWGVAINAPLSASGYHEVIATFETQKAAKTWVKETYGKFWYDRYIVFSLPTVFYTSVAGYYLPKKEKKNVR